MGTITLSNKVAGSPQSLVDLEADLQDCIANVAANASTAATCVTTPATTVSVADATTLTTALALINQVKVDLNKVIAENVVIKATCVALITQNATLKTSINASLTATKASGLQASA
jgi:hypothetical protein